MLLNINCNSVCIKPNPDTAYESFEENFFPIYNIFFALRQINFNKNIHKGEIWITKGLLISLLSKINLMKKSIVDPHSWASLLLKVTSVKR